MYLYCRRRSIFELRRLLPVADARDACVAAMAGLEPEHKIILFMVSVRDYPYTVCCCVRVA